MDDMRCWLDSISDPKRLYAFDGLGSTGNAMKHVESETNRSLAKCSNMKQARFSEHQLMPIRQRKSRHETREFFPKDGFHGNLKWGEEQDISQPMIWSRWNPKNITDVFDQTRKICDRCGLSQKISQTTILKLLMGWQFCQRFPQRLSSRSERSSSMSRDVPCQCEDSSCELWGQRSG